MDRREVQLGFLRSEISEQNPKTPQKPELNLKHCVTYIFFSRIEYNYNILKKDGNDSDTDLAVVLIRTRARPLGVRASALSQPEQLRVARYSS